MTTFLLGVAIGLLIGWVVCGVMASRYRRQRNRWLHWEDTGESVRKYVECNRGRILSALYAPSRYGGPLHVSICEYDPKTRVWT